MLTWACELRFGEICLMKGMFCSAGMVLEGSVIRTPLMAVNCLLTCPKAWRLLKFADVAGNLNCTITSIMAFGFESGTSGATVLTGPANPGMAIMPTIAITARLFFIRVLLQLSGNFEGTSSTKARGVNLLEFGSRVLCSW